MRFPSDAFSTTRSEWVAFCKQEVHDHHHTLSHGHSQKLWMKMPYPFEVSDYRSDLLRLVFFDPLIRWRIRTGLSFAYWNRRLLFPLSYSSNTVMGQPNLCDVRLVWQWLFLSLNLIVHALVLPNQAQAFRWYTNPSILWQDLRQECQACRCCF